MSPLSHNAKDLPVLILQQNTLPSPPISSAISTPLNSFFKIYAKNVSNFDLVDRIRRITKCALINSSKQSNSFSREETQELMFKFYLTAANPDQEYTFQNNSIKRTPLAFEKIIPIERQDEFIACAEEIILRFDQIIEETRWKSPNTLRRYALTLNQVENPVLRAVIDSKLSSGKIDLAIQAITSHADKEVTTELNNLFKIYTAKTLITETEKALTRFSH